MFHRNKQIFCLFDVFKLYQNPVQFFSVILCGVPLPHSNALQYCVKHEKSKVNDVIFPSGCEARAFNLGNKNSVKSKNIFTDISRHPTGKHEINEHYIGEVLNANKDSTPMVTM